MTQSNSEATCFICSLFDFKLTWMMDGLLASADMIRVERNSTCVTTKVKIPSTTWKRLTNIQCKAENHCFSAKNTIQMSGNTTR